MDIRHSFIYQWLEVCTLSSCADTHALRLTARAPEIELTSEKAHIDTSGLISQTCNMVSMRTIPTFIKARHRPPKLLYVHSQRSGIVFTIGTCYKSITSVEQSVVRTRSKKQDRWQWCRSAWAKGDMEIRFCLFETECVKV